MFTRPSSAAAGNAFDDSTTAHASRPCPLCISSEATRVFSGRDTVYDTPGTWWVIRCESCGMMFTDPAVSPADIRRHYPDSYAAHEAAGAQRRRRLRDPWDRLPPIGQMRLLDVGCGSGGYLTRMRDRGWRVAGVEPSGAAAAAARAAGLNVVEGVIPGAALSETEFDVTVMLGVIGCLPDPLATLQTLHAMLAPGGRLIVSEHNAASAASERFGPYWQGWDLPRHYNHLTPQSMAALLTRAGFRNVRLIGRRRSSRWRHSARAMLRERPGDRMTALIARSRLAASWLSALFGRGQRADEIIAEAER